METKRNRGFTLVEILIVVVILGILAAIVIPQFTNASTEANEANLNTNLHSIRSQIELYKIQHNDVPPTVAGFETEMTSRIGGFGPYLRTVPNNPFTGTNVVAAPTGTFAGDWGYTVTAATNAYTFVADDDATHATW